MQFSAVSVYTLYSSLGAILITRYQNSKEYWYQYNQGNISVRRGGRAIPLQRERRLWQVVKARSIEEAVKSFRESGRLDDAINYEASLVEGLDNGWDNQLIKSYQDQAVIINLSVWDFVPYQCLPLERRAFQFALKARAFLIDDLKELEKAYPLAGDWLDLIRKPLAKLIDAIDEQERGAPYLSQFHAVDGAYYKNSCEALANFKFKRRPEIWYDSVVDYPDSTGLLAEAIQLIAQALIACRLQLLNCSEAVQVIDQTREALAGAGRAIERAPG